MRSRSAPLATLVIALALCTPAAAGPPPPPTNILYGFITSSQTLTYAWPGPVYYVIGDVVINPGVTVTVEPGVTIEFTANRDTLQGGDYPSLGEILVRGNLVADAAAGDSIRFLSSAGANGQWGQLKIEGSATLARCALRGATKAIDAVQPVIIRDCSISASSVGAVICSGLMERCVIADAADYGVDMSSGSGILRECRITGRGSGTGLYLGMGASTAPADSTDPRPVIISGFTYGVGLLGGAFVQNVVSCRNQCGFRVYGNGSRTVTYCTAANNSQSGFELTGSPLQIFMCIAASNGAVGVYRYASTCVGTGMDYMNSWNNPQGNYALDGCYRGLNLASFNPFFQNPAANDYRLASGSVFKTYGPWGAEIGAYGPGPGTPVRAELSTWGRVKATYR